MTSDRGAEDTEFTGDDLATVRGLVHAEGDAAGLKDRTEALVIAVNEVAVNAVRYAGGRGRIRLERVPDGLLVQIQDDGPGLADGVSFTRPPSDALGGRGLWMARELCTDVQVRSGPAGVTVRLLMTRP